MGALLAFCISGVVLFGFIAFVVIERTRELRTYRVYRSLGDARVRTVGTHLHKLSQKFEHTLSLRSITRVTIHTLAYYTARIARVIERKAHKVTRAMTHPHNTRGAVGIRSSFLQEVQEHKKGLDIDAVRRDSSWTS